MVQRIEVEDHEIITTNGGQTIRLVEAGPPGPRGLPGEDASNYVPPLEVLGMLSPITRDAVIAAHAAAAGIPEENIPDIIEAIHQVDVTAVTSMDDVIANISDYLAHTSVGMMMISSVVESMYGEISSLSGLIASVDEKANTALSHAGSTGNPHGTTPSDIGAASVDHDHDGTYEAVGVAQTLINALSRPNGSVFYLAADQTEMLTLSGAKPGDFVFRLDQGNSLWGLAGSNPASLGDWTRIRDGDGTRSPIYPNIVDGRGELIVGTSSGNVDNLGAPATDVQSLVRDFTQPTGFRWDHAMPKLSKLSGEYYGLPSAAGAGGAMTYAGCFRAMPMWLPSGTIDRIAVVTTVAAISTWRLGIYKAGSNGYPMGQSPLLDAGTVNMNATTGIQSIALNYQIKSGFYWMVSMVDSYTAQPTYHTTMFVQQGSQGLFGAPINMSSLGRSQVGLWCGVPVPTGSLPTFPSSNITWSAQVPNVLVRYV